MEAKAWELIQKIDALGGSVSAIESGFMQEDISRSAYSYQRNIESGEKIIVGVNKFTIDKEIPIPGFKVDDSIRMLQTEKLKKLRLKRDADKATSCLAAIRLAATTSTNLMPLVIEAVENDCTLGEISDELRKVFGEHH